MTYKRIAFVAPSKAALENYDLGEPKENQVQVKLVRSTISSGTERANLIGSKSVDISCPEAKEAIFPRYVGYSSSGVVTAVGAGITDLHPGDRVVLGGSTHSQYLNIDRGGVSLLPDAVSFQDAAMFYIATFPLAAIRKCRLEIGESAIVMGLGVLGLTAVKLLKQAGAVPVIAVDPVPEKREKALQCGADFALDPMDADFAQTVKALTDGGAKVGVEVTGIGAGLDGILDCMARFGRVALLGCTRDKEFTIDYYRKVHGPGITLIGAHTAARPGNESHGGWWTQRDDMQAMIRLHEMNRIHLGDMVDEVHSVLEAPGVYDRLARERAFPIVQFDWSE